MSDNDRKNLLGNMLGAVFGTLVHAIVLVATSTKKTEPSQPDHIGHSDSASGQVDETGAKPRHNIEDLECRLAQLKLTSARLVSEIERIEIELQELAIGQIEFYHMVNEVCAEIDMEDDASRTVEKLEAKQSLSYDEYAGLILGLKGMGGMLN